MKFVISGAEFWFGSVKVHRSVRGLTTQKMPGISYLVFVIAAIIESYAESASARISSSVRS
jgi:hypothetical protein